MTKVIAFDLRPLQIGHQNRGIGMVIRSILENLEDSKNNYLFYMFDSSNPITDLGIKTNVQYTIVSTPSLKTIVDTPKDAIDAYKLAFHSFNSLRAYNPDVFLQFDFALGVPSWKRVKTFSIAYDLIPLIMRNEYLPSVKTVWHQSHGKKAKLKAIMRSLFYTARYKKYYMNYKKSDEIISISEATKHSFVEMLHIEAKKIHSLPLAPVASTDTVDTSIADSVNKPFVFYIGGTDSRKHVEDVIHTYNIARGRGHDIALVLAGNEFKDITKLPNIKARNVILNSPYRDDIHLVGFVDDAQKNGLYKGATAFLFMSSYEGFGLPVVEAAKAGCPVITYSNSSIPEAMGDSGILVETGNYTAAANALSALLSDDINRNELIKKGIANAKKYSWKTYTQSLLDILIR